MNLDSNDISRLVDELSLSIIRKVSPSKKQNEKRLQDAFRRRVKRHNNARTNQFEVIERLDGLEEKFQILTLDNLSDALHQRRRELREFEHQWLPDVLDFFLHLAGDPARNENLLRVYRVPPRIGTPPPLRWKDVLADDPIDRNDRLWRVPNFRDNDDSGYDDDDSAPSVNVSPSSKRGGPSLTDPETSLDKILQPHKASLDKSLLEGGHHRRNSDRISETVFIRETIFFLRGFPSRIVCQQGSQYTLASNVKVSGVSLSTLRPYAAQIIAIRQQIDLVQSWVAERHDSAYIEAMKDAVEGVLNLYNSRLDEMQQTLLDPTPSTTASMIRVMHNITDISRDVLTIADFLEQADRGEAISCLDTLFFAVQTIQVCGDDDAYKVLLEVLIPSLLVYLRLFWNWVQDGELEESEPYFFIKPDTGAAKNSRLWHDRYVLIQEGPSRPAHFITTLATRILACGKTASFIRQLTGSYDYATRTTGADLFTQQIIQRTRSNKALPFFEAFQHACFDDVNNLLESHTRTLKSLLNTGCGVEYTLDAISEIFLGQNMLILGEVEPKIFDRVDRCLEGWNDRFELRDMLETAFNAESHSYTIDAISIHSTFTSSRTMQSRRSSVKILSALSFRYRLSWPLANIINEEAMLVYRRVALMLMQIRRARCSLMRDGYLFVMNLPIDNEAGSNDQTFAQILAFTLISFINALYDCLTISIVQPLGQSMRREMEEALTVDDMIHAHKEYINRLECVCLASPKLKILRQSLVAILDLCIRFSDLVSNSTKAANGDSEVEAGSFTSALSRRRAAYDDDSESDMESEGGMADGYSSFIVLDNDTSVIKELRKVKTQYQRQLKFFIAGLKGVSKAGQYVQDLGLLADRLALCQHD